MLELLSRFAVRYVMVGGLAAIVHGSGRATFDIDIIPDRDEDNLTRLASALKDVDARLRVPDTDPLDYAIDARALARFEVSTWRTSIGDIGIIAGTPTHRRGELARYVDLASRAARRSAFGIPVLIADLDDVIESKEVLAREPDLAALPELHRLREGLAGGPGEAV